jgi:hypothetical protein
MNLPILGSKGFECSLVKDFVSDSSRGYCRSLILNKNSCGFVDFQVACNMY